MARKAQLPTVDLLIAWMKEEKTIPTTRVEAVSFAQAHGFKKPSTDVTDLVLSAARELVLEMGGDASEIEGTIDEELDAEPTEDEDDEELKAGGVVQSKYKAEYKARGRKADCGDWLALELEAIKGAATSAEWAQDYLALLDANGVDHSKYGRSSQGWFGRLRMSTGIALRRVVATQGFLRVGKNKRTPDAEWIAANTPKPKAKGGMSEETKAKLRAAKAKKAAPAKATKKAAAKKTKKAA